MKVAVKITTIFFAIVGVFFTLLGILDFLLDDGYTY